MSPTPTKGKTILIFFLQQKWSLPRSIFGFLSQSSAIISWKISFIIPKSLAKITKKYYMSRGRNYVHAELAMSKLGGPLSVVKVLNFLSFHYLKYQAFRGCSIVMECLSTLGCLPTVCFLKLVLVLLCGLVLSTRALAWVFPAGAGIVCVCVLALPLCFCSTCPSKSVKQVKHSTTHG